ncbi:MAG: Asp23/Gls24 family envelope stress response protein [Firmicutes bacterium]|nr:Asp23/Gls24 family envelope stress response protein [Bacillota bacterium]
MGAKIVNSNGVIEISADVIALIAGDAAMRCYGVVGMAVRSAADGIVSLVRRDNASKGIKIIVDEGGLSIDIHVVVEYGVNIKVASNSIIESVKYNVEQSTGFIVKQVNVHVESVRVD